MGVVGFPALAANVTSVLVLAKYREGDANIRSVWLCSRNDPIGNVAVMGAALAVWATASKWPDLLVAAIMAGLFLASSSQILRNTGPESSKWASTAQWEKYGRPRLIINFGKCASAGTICHDERIHPENIFPSHTRLFGRLGPGRGSSTHPEVQTRQTAVQSPSHVVAPLCGGGRSDNATCSPPGSGRVLGQWSDRRSHQIAASSQRFGE
jgi:hypothetical protein